MERFQAAVEGGDPLSRAEVAYFEVTYQEDACSNSKSTKSTLDQCQREKLDEVLSEFSCVFAESLKKPAITSTSKHRIDTGNSRQVKQRIQRVSPSVEEEINKQVDDMLVNGICRASTPHGVAA